jgi:hypothetical protein
MLNVQNYILSVILGIELDHKNIDRGNSGTEYIFGLTREEVI